MLSTKGVEFNCQFAWGPTTTDRLDGGGQMKGNAFSHSFLGVPQILSQTLLGKQVSTEARKCHLFLSRPKYNTHKWDAKSEPLPLNSTSPSLACPICLVLKRAWMDYLKVDSLEPFTHRRFRKLIV